MHNNPPCEELDAGDHQPGKGAFNGGFKIFGQPAVAVEPSDGALDHPAPRQQGKALGAVGTLDDLDRPSPELGQRCFELGAGIAGIGKNVAQPRETVADRGQQRNRTVAILNLGTMDDGPDQPAARIGDDVALAALDFLAGVEPARAARLGGLDRLAVDYPDGDGLASRPAASRAGISSV